MEFVAAFLSRNPPQDTEAVLVDGARLVGSELPDWAIESLWSLGSYPRHDLRREGWNGRDWLDRVLQQCRARLADAGRDAPMSVPPSPYLHLAQTVLDEILVVAEPMTEASLNPGDTGRVAGPPGLVPALCELTTKVCPDLAFRLFLNALACFGPRSSPEQYDRYRGIGRQFGYGDNLVESHQYLIAS
ncbi:hypothetical protein [Kitasatospora indigofera]|uniref:hypothetical protein n=1 Tax=Kitasatospora indigofera TaxID=67307 RepID=UPI0033B3C6F6